MMKAMIENQKNLSPFYEMPHLGCTQIQDQTVAKFIRFDSVQRCSKSVL